MGEAFLIASRFNHDTPLEPPDEALGSPIASSLLIQAFDPTRHVNPLPTVYGSEAMPIRHWPSVAQDDPPAFR